MKKYTYPPEPPETTLEQMVIGLSLAISLVCMLGLIIETLLG